MNSLWHTGDGIWMLPKRNKEFINHNNKQTKIY